MMHRIRRTGFSMKNKWSSFSVSDVGSAGILSVAAERLLTSELSKRAMMKSVYQREYSVGFSHPMSKVVDNDETGIAGSFSVRLVPPKTRGRQLVENVYPFATLDSKKLRALSRVTDSIPTEKLPTHIVYLIELGMDLEAIRKAIRRYPHFASCSLDRKIKPLVEFLVDLGIQKQHIPAILRKEPSLCGMRLTENLIPTVAFLEESGIDKKQWAKVICRCPNLLPLSRQKMKTGVEFLYEMGLSAENVGKVLTRWPQILTCSVEEKLRPTAEYFRSLEVDVGVFLHRSPAIFGLSIEGNLKPKWEFFLTMVYPKSALLRFPPYFSYSLEDRIKPRYEIVRKSGVKVDLSQMLARSDHGFQELLQEKMRKKHSHLHVSVA